MCRQYLLLLSKLKKVGDTFTGMASIADMISGSAQARDSPTHSLFFQHRVAIITPSTHLPQSLIYLQTEAIKSFDI